MNYYQKLILETCVDAKPKDAAEIEDYMRDNIFHSTLDWQTKKQLTNAALKAWKDIKYLRSPEGQALLKQIEEE